MYSKCVFPSGEVTDLACVFTPRIFDAFWSSAVRSSDLCPDAACDGSPLQLYRSCGVYMAGVRSPHMFRLLILCLQGRGHLCCQEGKK